MDKPAMKKARKTKPVPKKSGKMGTPPVESGKTTYVYRKDAFKKVKLA